MKLTNINNDVVYNAERPIITVLFETEFTKEIRIVMQEGTVMKEHKAPLPIVVEIVKGKIQFGVNEEVVEMTAGSIIALDANIYHDLKADQDSIVRLTLNKSDDSNRVKSVVA